VFTTFPFADRAGTNCDKTRGELARSKTSKALGEEEGNFDQDALNTKPAQQGQYRFTIAGTRHEGLRRAGKMGCASGM
jgi:hypothetical protein